MSTLPSVFKLPPEVSTSIFETASLRRFDLIQCMIVCSRWYPIVEAVFYKDLLITKNSNFPLFIRSLKRRDIGPLIKNLIIAHKSRWYRMPPFTIQDHSRLLKPKCQNIVTISMTNMNPYYMLRSLENFILPKLEQIDVYWETCAAAPCIEKRFYGANFNHRLLIRCINMPGNPTTDDLSFYIDGVITNFTKEEFFGSFDHLERFEFQP